VGDRIDLTPLVGTQYPVVSVGASPDKTLIAWGGKGAEIAYAFLGADGQLPTQHSTVSVDGETAGVYSVVYSGSAFYILWWSHAGAPPVIPHARMGVIRVAPDGTALGTQRLAWI